LWDRQGTVWRVFDVDGTRQAARQRALPQTDDRPAARRRMSQVCAPGYTGGIRGEVVRTRTVVVQAHTHQDLGTFSGAGNGDYRGELGRAKSVIAAYMQAQSLPLTQAIIRLDGLYGNGAIVADLAGFVFVLRGKEYHLLDLPAVQARLLLPPDALMRHPETGMERALFDLPCLPVTAAGDTCRVVVATHPTTTTSAPVGETRGQVVYELFFTALPQAAFTASDVVNLYLHRGAEDRRALRRRSGARSRSLVFAHPLRAGVLANSVPMGLELALRTGPTARIRRPCGPPSLLLPTRKYQK
jgi:hypothetical protein